MSVPQDKRSPGFFAAVLKRTGEPRAAKARGKVKRKRVGYLATNGPTAGDEAAIGTGGAGGGGAGGA